MNPTAGGTSVDHTEQNDGDNPANDEQGPVKHFALYLSLATLEHGDPPTSNQFPEFPVSCQTLISCIGGRR
jgi:hypothetical protein